jgi:alanine racemase
LEGDHQCNYITKLRERKEKKTPIMGYSSSTLLLPNTYFFQKIRFGIFKFKFSEFQQLRNKYGKYICPVHFVIVITRVFNFQQFGKITITISNLQLEGLLRIICFVAKHQW